MRIALASIHPRALSGQIEELVGLAQALSRQGHTVSIVSPFPSERLLDVNRARLAAHSPRVFLDQPLRMARVLVRLMRLASSVDLIQLDLPTPAFSMFADILQALVRVPVVVGYEAHLVRTSELLRRDRLWQAPEFYGPRLLINNSLVARLTVRAARCYIVHSQYQKQELVRLGVRPERVQILAPVLPCDKMEPGSSAMRSLLPPGRIMTYIGHYNHVKGVDILVRAFRALLSRFPDLNLVLAWSGLGANRTLDRLLHDEALKNRVYHFGQVSVPEMLAASDLVVLPYRMSIGQAAYPAMLLEALVAGVPVVTADLPLFRELTQGGKTAQLVPPDNPAALASAIECVLTDASLVKEMRQAQQRWALQIQPQRVIREYERVYQQVVARQAGVLRPAGDREQLR